MFSLIPLCDTVGCQRDDLNDAFSKFAWFIFTWINWAPSSVECDKFASSKLQPVKSAPDRLACDKFAL